MFSQTFVRCGVALVVCASLLSWIAQPVTGASSTPRLSLASLVSQSDSVLSGHVQRTWTAWDSSHQFIWTHYLLTVDSVWKGQRARSFVVSEPGGTLGGITMQVAGATPYAVGEDVAVFSYRTPIGVYRTTGYGQGKVAIAANGIMHSNGVLKDVEGLSQSEFGSRVRSLAVAQPAGRGR